MRKSRATGGRDLRDLDLKHHEFPKESKVLETAKEKNGGGPVGKQVGGIAGAHARANGGRAPRKDGGRTGADSNPFSSARHGKSAPGRKVDGELDA